MELDDPTAQSEVLLSERTGHVLVLTLNRPQARNALNPELKDAILAATAAADHEPDVRAVVITGNGPVFCAGMDLKAFAGDPVTAARAEQFDLVNKVVPAGEVRKEAITLAGKLAANGPLAVALTKKLIRERRWAHADETAAIFRSADALEGARAFAERRPPAWTGK